MVTKRRTTQTGRRTTQKIPRMSVLVRHLSA